MLSLQDEVRKRKFELALMESELASMEVSSISPRYAAHILQDQRVRCMCVLCACSWKAGLSDQGQLGQYTVTQ